MPLNLDDWTLRKTAFIVNNLILLGVCIGLFSHLSDITFKSDWTPEERSDLLIKQAALAYFVITLLILAISGIIFILWVSPCGLCFYGLIAFANIVTAAILCVVRSDTGFLIIEVVHLMAIICVSLVIRYLRANGIQAQILS